MRKKSRFERFAWPGLAALVAASCAAAGDANDEIFAIGPRRERVEPAARWFKNARKIDEAFYREALAAARLLAAPENPEKLHELDELKSAIAGEKDACGKAFLWLLDSRHCSDPAARRGAIAGLALSETEAKTAGKLLGASAVYDPDSAVRTAAIQSIKQSKDPYAEAAILNAWKAAFDNSGIPTVNEEQRKAAVAAMHDIDDKRVFQVLVWYATLELRAQTGTLARVDQVAIKGQGINLPIDLPAIDIISAEGNIAIPALSSLKQATGQDFGHNMDRWNAWLATK
jgi:hypothetical protein